MSQRLKLATGKFISLKPEYRNLSLSEVLALKPEQREVLYCWDKDKQKATKGNGNIEKLNQYLISQEKKANDIIIKYDLINKPLTLVSGRLKDSMTKGEVYLVKVFVAKPFSWCPPGINKVTVSFTKNELKKHVEPFHYPLKYISLLSDSSSILKKPNVWVPFSSLYRSTGGEQYVHLGDFKNKISTNIKEPEIIVNDSIANRGCFDMYFDSVVVEKIDMSKPFVLNGINFESNQSKLLLFSERTLDNIYEIIKSESNSKIKIFGYTDNTGDSGKNILLSKQRAEAVKNYLIKKGVAKVKILTDGLGENNPVANNNNPYGRIKNRRVEIQIIK